MSISFCISSILVFTAVLGLVLAGRIYRLDKKNYLYRLTSLAVVCCAGLAFLEYEISRQTAIGPVLQLDPIHTILSSFTIYLSLCSIWIFTQPFGKNKFKGLNWGLALCSLLMVGSIWFAILSSSYRIPSEVEYSRYIWQYVLRLDNNLNKLFVCWYALQFIVLNFAFWAFYKKEKNKDSRNWMILLFSAMSFFTCTMFLVFVFNGSLEQKGFYYVSPWILVCCTLLGYAYTNFKLFTASPINALDNILESMSNLMAIADTEFNVTYLNRATREELALVDQQLPKITFHDLAKTFKVDKWGHDVKKISTLRKEQKYAREFNLLYEGNQLAYHMTFSPIFNEQNIKTGYLAIATNITKVKKVELQLKKYTEELEQSNTELERFAYIASHDLKTPLRSVTSFLNLIQQRIQKSYQDPEIEEFLQYAVNGAGQMYHLIQDVLEFSTINKEAPKKNQKVDLNETIKDVCHALKTVIEEKQAVVYTVPLPSIWADELRMIQLFQNIIENGIKYNNSKRPTIYISFQEDESFYQISIKDNGIGIDQIYSTQIFEMFKRLHRPNEYEGTGIGLAICKKIVINHGGDISLRSKKGEGSQFNITLKKDFLKSDHLKQLPAPPTTFD